MTDKVFSDIRVNEIEIGPVKVNRVPKDFSNFERDSTGFFRPPIGNM